MHTTNAYSYNSVTQENNNKNQTVNKKQQSINNWSWHIPEMTTTYYILSNKVRTMKLQRVILYFAGSNRLTRTRSTASNLEQVACAQTNSASYPQQDGTRGARLMWVTGWRPSVGDWVDGVYASCNVDYPNQLRLPRLKMMMVTSLTHVAAL